MGRLEFVGKYQKTGTDTESLRDVQKSPWSLWLNTVPCMRGNFLKPRAENNSSFILKRSFNRQGIGSNPHTLL